VRLGSLEVGRYGPSVAEHPSAYMDRLAELAGMLRGLPWFLAGGLAIPVTLGRFYRRHHDVDIAFPEDTFQDVEAAMRRAGYALWTYFPMSLFGACKFAVLVRIRANSALARYRPRKLKMDQLERGVEARWQGRHGHAMRRSSSSRASRIARREYRPRATTSRSSASGEPS